MPKFGYLFDSIEKHIGRSFSHCLHSARQAVRPMERTYNGREKSRHLSEDRGKALTDVEELENDLHLRMRPRCRCDELAHRGCL